MTSCCSFVKSPVKGGGGASGADPGGGPRGPGPPPTLGFEAPKLSIFGPYLNFS